MTVKKKLFIGFGVIIIMILLLGIISWLSLNKASKGFKEYRIMAKQSLLLGQVQANMLMVRMNAKDYFLSGLNKDADQFYSYYEKVSSLMKSAKTEVKNPKRAKIIDIMDKELIEYKENFGKIQNLTQNEKKLIDNELNILGKESEKLLTVLMESTYNDKNSLLIYESALAMRTFLLSRLYVVKYIEKNEINDKNRVINEFENLNNSLDKLENKFNNREMNELLTNLRGNIEKYQNSFKKLVLDIDEKSRLVNEKMDKVGPDFTKLVDAVKLDLKKEQNEIGPRVQDSNEMFIIIISIISIFIITLVVFLSIIIPKGIVGSLDRVSLGLESFFDYLNRKTHNVEEIKINTNDEFGKMAKMINANVSSIEDSLEQDEILINEVKKVVSQIDEGDLSGNISSSTINKSLNELKTIFNNMLLSFREKVAVDLTRVNEVLEECSNRNFTSKIDDQGEFCIKINNLISLINDMLSENMKNGLILANSSDTLLNNVDILNKNSNEAAAALEETAAALEEVTGNVSSTTENVVLMANHAREVMKSSEIGEKLANQTAQAMDEINDEVKAINEAISVIDQIAFQTNILSLNAAVEAATAGEAGKGFAVVAQEVRNLAARSAEAAKEIKDLVEKATNKASNGKEISNDMIEGYNGLNGSISKTIELIEDVELASKEQQEGIIQINDAVNSLDKQTQENAAIAAQTQEVALKTDSISKRVVNNANKSSFSNKEHLKSKTPDSLDSLNSSDKTLEEDNWISF